MPRISEIAKWAPLSSSLGLLVWLACLPAEAGEHLGQSELLSRSRAVVEVDVHFQGDREVSLDHVRWLAGKPSSAPNIRTRRHRCITTRGDLKLWLRSYPKFPARTRRLWRRLVRRRGYHAVLFWGSRLPTDARWQPYCEGEVMNLLHTDVHPDFRRWRKRLLRRLSALQTP